MNWKQFFRAAVCLLVVCCLIVNISLPQARAIAVADDIAIGITACLILMAAGVVFAPKTAADITAIGNSMSTYMYQWGTEAEKTDEVESWLGGLTIYNGGSDEDGDGVEDTPRDRKVQLARGILGGITAWVASVILGTTKISVEEDAAEGYAYYNGVLLPDISSYINETYSFATIVYDNSASKYCLYTTGASFYLLDGDFIYAKDAGFSYKKYYVYSTSVSLDVTNSLSKGKYIAADHSFIWSNFDLKHSNTYAVICPASEPSIVISNPIDDPAYLGDIPSGIQDGTLTADGITLPDVLDYTELVPLGKPATDAVIDTSNDLIDGTLPYEDYLQQITGDAVTGVTIVSPDTVTAGSYITIQADASGSGDFDTACICTLSGATSADTALTETEYDNTWTLSCGADETAQMLTVTVQSVADASITAVKEITVRESGVTAPSEDTDTSPDYSGVLDGIQDAVGDLQTGIGNVVDGIANLPQAIMDGIKGLFVPSDGYIEAKVNSLTSEFAFANSIAQTGNAFKTFFVDMGMKPPIIYIDFSSARGSFSPSGQYALGGKAVFVDLTWYAEYKPTVDGLLSAFLWLWFCWRMLLSLPGILQGTSGMWGSGDSLAGFEPWSIPRRLDSGSSGRLLGTSEHHQRFNSERKRFWER